ncbi:MAG: rRNA maturation RNase YbeY [Bacteroidales bacterium]|nr:rRNA maturation RNase YbeY [Bacteroidales bacterium]
MKLKFQGILVLFFVTITIYSKLMLNFLNHSYLTDVITFNENSKNIVNGSIFISLDRVTENANIYSGTNFLDELLRVIIHGILHLMGYDDNNAVNTSLMRQKENFYLNKLSLHF